MSSSNTKNILDEFFQNLKDFGDRLSMEDIDVAVESLQIAFDDLKLMKKAAVEKRKEAGNAKNLHLYVTAEGAKTSKAHKMYDINDIAKTMSELQEKCSPEEIDTFYKVIGVYNEVIKKDFEINKTKMSFLIH